MKIDIVLPTYNRALLLKYAIESVKKQTYENWSLYIIDNCSDDTTQAVSQEYLCDKRISYVRQKAHVPIYKNWQTGSMLVDGDYFMILSDDDYLHPSCMQTVVDSVYKNAAPDFLIFGRGTIIPIDDSAIIKNKLILNKKRSGDSRFINPKSIANAYATCEAISSEVPDGLHPSQIMISNNLKQKIEKVYPELYHRAAPDYFSGVLLGLYAQNVIYIDADLVLIGGHKKAPYCISSSKFEYFGMTFNEEKRNIDVLSGPFTPVAKLLERFWEYPYFNISIMKQTIITLTEIKNSDEKKYNEFLESLWDFSSDIEDCLIESTVENYKYCLTCGDKTNYELAKLELTKGYNLQFLKRYLKIVLRSLVKVMKSKFLEMVIIMLHNILSKKNRWIYYHSIQDAFQKFSKK